MLKNVGAIINRPAVKPYEFAGSRAKRQHFTAGRIIRPYVAENTFIDTLRLLLNNLATVAAQLLTDA